MNALINSFFLNNCSGMLGEQLNFPHCEALLPQTDGVYDSISFVFMYIYSVNLVYSIKYVCLKPSSAKVFVVVQLLRNLNYGNEFFLINSCLQP